MTEYGTLSVRHLTSIAELDRKDVDTIFALAKRVKAERYTFPKPLANQRLMLLFEKESLRTRVTFDVAMQDLGGSAIYIDQQDVRLGAREALKDVARNLSRWCHGIVARTYRHRTVLDLAKHAEIPVINGLTDFLHPCQGLTDFFTMTEVFGSVEGRTFAYVGDGNNTCHSLIHCAALLGCHIRVAGPEGYEPNSKVVNHAMRIAKETGSEVSILEDPQQAVDGADAVYTDVWASMGQEEETEERAERFSPYRVDSELMAAAKPGAIFLHCLPAHRGAEVTSDVIDSDCSKVLQNAENRLHVQKAILLLLMGQNPLG
ncbi:MAG: ornithine carbamoyltransferase [Planctomycetes bacterium]|nr:ornithine carbamoyltransferase [Planctomycetota bacterium]MCB9917087.1 ornithine carbamoyltransferase [Planctomycetota bacterium]